MNNNQNFEPNYILNHTYTSCSREVYKERDIGAYGPINNQVSPVDFQNRITRALDETFIGHLAQ